MLSLFSARFPAVPTAGLSPGVDLSGWQAASIWGSLGWVEWSCSKVSEGAAFEETAAIGHSQAAKAKGVPWGLYHFAKFADVQAEAARYLAGVDMVTRNVGAPDFHMLDLEAPAGGDVTVWAEQWCRTVEQASPLPIIVYTGAGWANQYLTTPGTGLDRRPLWVAHYANSGVTGPWVPSLWSDWMIWQWSSSTALGSLDVNVENDTYTQRAALFTGVGCYWNSIRDARWENAAIVEFADHAADNLLDGGFGNLGWNTTDIGYLRVLDNGSNGGNNARQHTSGVPDTALPTANAEFRGQFMVKAQAATEDKVCVCVRDSGGAYKWINVKDGSMVT